MPCSWYQPTSGCRHRIQAQYQLEEEMSHRRGPSAAEILKARPPADRLSSNQSNASETLRPGCPLEVTGSSQSSWLVPMAGTEPTETRGTDWSHTPTFAMWSLGQDPVSAHGRPQAKRDCESGRWCFVRG